MKKQLMIFAITVLCVAGAMQARQWFGSSSSSASSANKPGRYQRAKEYVRGKYQTVKGRVTGGTPSQNLRELGKRAQEKYQTKWQKAKPQGARKRMRYTKEGKRKPFVSPSLQREKYRKEQELKQHEGTSILEGEIVL